jgi:hypothetical protein
VVGSNVDPLGTGDGCALRSLVGAAEDKDGPLLGRALFDGGGSGVGWPLGTADRTEST